MGIVREIHSAYGITLKGEYEVYHWYDGRDDDVIWRIWVNDREIYLGRGHFIISEDKTEQYINMESDKDLLCYWLSKNPMDDYALDRFFTDSVGGYRSCWWRSHARDRMLRDRLEEQRKAEADARKSAEEIQMAAYKAYADKKNLYMIRDYNVVHFLKLNKKNAKAIGVLDDDVILEFAKNYPGHGCDIVETKEVMV